MKISKSQYMLKYQKAKVKLLEYDVPKEQYPKFKLNYRDLAFPTVLTVSDYAIAVIEDNEQEQIRIKKLLSFCSEFYDAAMKSREQISNDLNFLLTGAISYFFQDNYGSAMVLLTEIHENEVTTDMRGTLINIFNLIFGIKKEIKANNTVDEAFEEYIKSGSESNVYVTAEDNCYQAYNGNNELDAFFADAIYAIIKIAIKNSASKLLPQYSSLDKEKWSDYFEKDNSIKMVWPAQKLIGEKGILKGENAIVQLPTGVGKTKSIELIIRSLFLSERGKTALVVAPLRALCNEITDDMQREFKGEAEINQFSDVLEIDFDNLFLNEKVNKVIICTPEKLQFIIHHQNEILEDIDLFIFDEGHLFDDMSRGPLFELLITNLKTNIKEQQLVILSAVLSNADKILQWIMGEKGVLAFDNNIKSTPKVIGFSSIENEIHYYSDSFHDEDFFIPRAINYKELKSGRANAKKKFFPDNNTNDRALYYANQLCINGGIAIYMSQKRYVLTILKRLLEIKKRGCELDRVKDMSDQNELIKLNKLIGEYYGDDHIYSKATEIGFLPHYSTLPNGLRVSIEYAFRKQKIKAVVCTSTLAQGVNIPIKYMIMTSLRSAQQLMSTRSLQNLIGRTARSGVYTEGSILITDSKLYDNRNGWKGKYAWNDVVNLFEPSNTEECSSAILRVVQNIEVDYELIISGGKICKFISEHICENWWKILEKSLIKYIEKKGKDGALNKQVINERVNEYKKIIGTIENEICFELSKDNQTKMYEALDIKLAATKILNNTLAFFLATEDEKKDLEKLFMAICDKLYNKRENIKRIAESLVDIDVFEIIMSLINDEGLNETKCDDIELLTYAVDLYNEIYNEDAIDIKVCLAWINGDSYKDMEDEFGLEIKEIEKKCGYSLSYQLSFLIGNIIDLLDAESLNLQYFMLLQKQLKYGVKSITALSICEKIFNDRIVANLITSKLSNKNIEESKIRGVFSHLQDEILLLINEYPIYFTERVKFLKR